MSRDPRAFFALDRGAATTSVSLVAFVGERWRLVASASAPAGVDADALLFRILERASAADPDLLGAGGRSRGAAVSEAAHAVDTWPRLEALSSEPPKLGVLAGSRRQERRLTEAARRAGWRPVSGSTEDANPLELSALALSLDTGTLLIGADSPVGGDERRHLAQLVTIALAAARRRPELRVILAGGAAAYAEAFAEIGMRRLDPTPLAVPLELPERHEADDAEPAHDAVAETAAGDADADDVAHPEPQPDDEDRHVVDIRAVGPQPPEDERRPAGDAPAAPVPEARSEAADAPSTGAERGGLVLAPDPDAGSPRGSALQRVLESLAVGKADSRVAMARSLASLAYVLDRTVEGIEVGMQGGLRCRAEPLPGDGRRTVASSYALLATGALLPDDLPPAILDSIHSWSTIPLDRYRLADRLLDIRAMPWADVDGEGALLRLAAARAAVERMVAATPDLSARATPDLIVAGGGVWSAIPAPVVALALADLVRRSGASQLALDAARLLAPIGVIEDESERRSLLSDLADDLLVPLGSVLLPSGMRPGRPAGRLRVRSGTAVADVELQPGGIEIVDLPPGQEAVAELDFRDTVRLGVRGRRFAIDVTGGLGGLLVDLRDIPLRLPERPEARRELLDAWQKALWSGLEV